MGVYVKWRAVVFLYLSGSAMLDFYRLVWFFERGFNNSTRLVFAVLHLQLARARSGSGPR